MTVWNCLVVSGGEQARWRAIDAPSEKAVIAQLLAEGSTPLEIRGSSLSLLDRLNQPIRFNTGLRLGERALLMDQLATLVRAGLAVDRSLDLLREQAPRASQRALLTRVIAKIRDGGGLAAALDEERVFPSYATGVIRAAERGGKLADALAALAERLRLVTSTRRRLIAALTYPAAVLTATIVALMLVLTLVVPQFEPIFAGEEARLPVLTRAVLALSKAVTEHGLLVLLLVVLVPLSAVLFVRSAPGIALVDQHRHQIAFLRLRDQYLASQFTGVFSTLLANGVGVVAALGLARDAIGSRRWRRHLHQVERQVREGARLSAALSSDRLLPSAAVRLIEVGERSGQLAETSERASNLLGEAANARIESLVALVNPIAIIVLGGMVAMLMAGVMLGIFALGDFAG